jgi:hypothetical protein
LKLENEKILNNKLSKLFELTKEMLDLQKNNRPNCEQILNEKQFWSLSLNEIKDQNELLNRFLKDKNFEENFSVFFVEKKLNSLK